MTTQETSQALDATLAAVGHKVTMGGAASTFFGWLLSSQGAALVGIVGVLGGLLIQWYYRRKQDRRDEAEDRRKQEEHDRRMGLME